MFIMKYCQSSMQHDRVKVRFLSRGNIFAVPSMTILTRLPTGRQDMSVVVVVVVTVNLYKNKLLLSFSPLISTGSSSLELEVVAKKWK